MMKRWFQSLFAVIGGLLGYELSGIVGKPFFSFIEVMFGVEMIKGQTYWMMLIGAGLFFMFSSNAAKVGVKWLQQGEDKVALVPLTDMVAGTAGMVVGLLLAVLLMTPF